MSRHNHTLFMSIQCIMSLLSRCIVGHPTSVNLTSLSRGNQFHRSIKGAYNCIPAFDHSVFHHGDYISAKKKCFPPLRPSLPSVGRFSVRWWFIFAIGRISSPNIAENNKLFSIIAVSLNASLFDRQLRCHSDKWPINANTRVSSLLWLQWELQCELPKFLLGFRHKYFPL